MKKLMLQVAAAAILAAGTMAVTSSAASADVVCNGAGECWHTHDHYKYDPGFGVVVHPDNWKWGDADHYKWREHEGRGYWRASNLAYVVARGSPLAPYCMVHSGAQSLVYSLPTHGVPQMCR